MARIAGILSHLEASTLNANLMSKCTCYTQQRAKTVDLVELPCLPTMHRQTTDGGSALPGRSKSWSHTHEIITKSQTVFSILLLSGNEKSKWFNAFSRK